MTDALDKWVSAAVEQKYIRPVAAGELQSGVYCTAQANAWYDDGVSFDWSSLHRHLTTSSAKEANAAWLCAEMDALADAGVRALTRLGADACMGCVIELHAPWTLQPLSSQAQQLSVFALRDKTAAAAAAADAAKCDGATVSAEHDRLYTFLRGPPGQRPVVRDISRVLRDVARQLCAAQAAGVPLTVVQCLGSFVVFADEFTTLLHHTAAVHTALRQAGLEVNMHFSSFAPRRVMADGHGGWCVLPLAALTAEDDVVRFLADLFFQWLQDMYCWACEAPVQVFPDLPTRTDAPAQQQQQSLYAQAVGTSSSDDVRAKRVRLFERFVRGLVVPQMAHIGLTALHDLLPEAPGGDLFERAQELVQAKRAPVGPQKWTMLDLRLTLHQLGAYSKSPASVLGGACAAV